MTEIDKIKNREEVGYTMSVYGTRENLYMQMREDIMTLINHIEGQTLPIDSVSNRRETLEKFADDWNNSKLKEELIFERDINSHLKGETF